MKFNFNRKNLFALTFILSAVINLCACDGKKFNLPKKDISITKADGTTIICRAEIADEYEERQYGFMNRKKIPQGTGMLFVFEKDQILSFWMKNTPTALSIAYIDYKGQIADIQDMTPFSEKSIISSRSVRYALEVPQGWFKKNGISCGDTVDLSVLKN